jgi:hypothetical protein
MVLRLTFCSRRHASQCAAAAAGSVYTASTMTACNAYRPGTCSHALRLHIHQRTVKLMYA